MRICAVLLLVAACQPAQQPPRAAGDRQPLSAPCETLDGTRCLLPWPSSTYTVVDATTPTGLRVAVAQASLPIADDPKSLNRGDGFSVITPLAAGFPRPVNHLLDGVKTTTAVRLLVAQPGASLGSEVPLRLALVNDDASTNETDSMVVAYPRLPLAYETDYVAVITDELTADDGTPFTAPRAVQVALGLAAPSTNAEAALVAYHAPTRALLQSVGIDATHVLRVWDFTTRSLGSVTTPLSTMVAATPIDQVTITIDSATLFTDGSALDVRGHLGNLPAFADATGWLSVDGNGVPAPVGVATAPFRAVLPANGSGAYPVVIYGHGTGGTVDDTTFDTEIVAAGAAKLSVEWTGWTASTAINTLVGFQNVFTGTDTSTARLTQALRDENALRTLMGGALGATLSAATIAGTANPASGRLPDAANFIYAGGSLGGTMGYVVSSVDSGLKASVLNVPGAGWTHFAPDSLLWSMVSVLFISTTPSTIDVRLSLAMTQNNWDAVDGGAWAAMAPPRLLLEQESIGDPVLPNIGSELVAASSGAVQVGAVIEPIAGVSPVASATQTAITQFRVPSSVTDALQIHGFAANDSPAGIAARQQISAFITSVWAGSPRIDPPASCPNGNCDFSSN